MKRVIAVLILVIGIANAEIEEPSSLVLPFEEIHLPQATQEFNNAKAKLIKAKNNKEQWSNTMKQRYITGRQCRNGFYCIDAEKYVGYSGIDEYCEWSFAKKNGENLKVSPQKKQKFEQLEKAFERFDVDIEKVRELDELEEFAKRDLAKAEYYKTIAQIKESDEEKAQSKYDETISYLRNYETNKAKYLRGKQEEQEIKVQKNKLEKELKQINKEFERAKYNKLQQELERLRKKSKDVSFYDTERVYEKFEKSLDKLIGEL